MLLYLGPPVELSRFLGDNDGRYRGSMWTRRTSRRSSPTWRSCPIDALQGVSAADAEALQKAFGVKTIRQLAEHKFIKAAQAITLLAGAK